MNNEAKTAAKALAYAWVAPKMNRHRATIERIGDPTVNAALAAIEGGQKQLSKVQPGPVADLLHLAAAAIDDIPQHVIEQYKEHDAKAAALADELFSSTGKTATLAISIGEHFTGNYPPEWKAEKTCSSGGRIVETKEGISITKHTAKLWRPRMMEGLYLPACPHCQHNHAWRICQQIEQEASQYRQGQLGLRFLVVGKGGRAKLAARARKHKQRTGEDVRYWAMPQATGGAAIVHNMPEWGGEELPGTRPGLFSLILETVENADLKQNTSSSSGWGGMFQGTKGNSKTKSANSKEDDIQPATDEVERIKLHVRSWSKLGLLFEGAYEHKLKTKDKLTIGIVELVNLLDAAGLEYGILAGADRLASLMEHVTDLVHTPSTSERLCTKSVTNSHPSQQPLPNLGQKPAPIYLNGEWIE